MIKAHPWSFGFYPQESQHFFQVMIPDKYVSPENNLIITEHFEWGEAHAADPGIPYVNLSLDRWLLIADPVRVDFNVRLQRSRLTPGRWYFGANYLERLFGKELVVLAWAIEQAPLDKIQTAVQNWSGLAPEERWWLCTQAAANSTVRDAIAGRGLGWRAALQTALCYS